MSNKLRLGDNSGFLDLFDSEVVNKLWIESAIIELTSTGSPPFTFSWNFIRGNLDNVAYSQLLDNTVGSVDIAETSVVVGAVGTNFRYMVGRLTRVVEDITSTSLLLKHIWEVRYSPTEDFNHENSSQIDIGEATYYVEDIDTTVTGGSPPTVHVLDLLSSTNGTYIRWSSSTSIRFKQAEGPVYSTYHLVLGDSMPVVVDFQDGTSLSFGDPFETYVYETIIEFEDGTSPSSGDPFGLADILVTFEDGASPSLGDPFAFIEGTSFEDGTSISSGDPFELVEPDYLEFEDGTSFSIGQQVLFREYLPIALEESSRIVVNATHQARLYVGPTHLVRTIE